MSLEGKVALVTGSGRGIGRVVAISLAEAGIDVAINYMHSETQANELAKKIESFGRKTLVVKADVTKEIDVEVLVNKVYSYFNRIDILVNNVGDWLWKKAEDMSFDEWKKVIETNLNATFLCSKYVLPHMKMNGWGRIVNFAAAGAYRAHGTANASAFYTAKAGIVAFTKSLAREVGQYGVTVNAVAPGVVENKERTVEEAKQLRDKETAMGRPGTSWDIAKAILFLASDEASFITGDVINITGGWLI